MHRRFLLVVKCGSSTERAIATRCRIIAAHRETRWRTLALDSPSKWGIVA